MPEQSDWIAEQEKIKLSKEIEAFITKATAKNIQAMTLKMGGNISFNEHLIIQRTLQTAKACITDKTIIDIKHSGSIASKPAAELTDEELDRVISGS